MYICVVVIILILITSLSFTQKCLISKFLNQDKVRFVIQIYTGIFIFKLLFCFNSYGSLCNCNLEKILKEMNIQSIYSF